MSHKAIQARLERQFSEGHLPAEDAAELDAHLRTCADCRAYYGRLVALEDLMDPSGGARLERLLARGAPVAEDHAPFSADLSDAPSPNAAPERPAKPQSPATVRAPRPALIWGAVALAVACGLVFLVMDPEPSQGPSKTDVTARGGDGKTVAKISIYSRGPDASDPVESVAHALRQDDGLLFAYTHPRAGSAQYLAIVGRDANGRIHWYHPHYANADQQPESVRIKAGVADRELPRVVFAPHALGPLQICPVFAQKPVDVVELDARLEAGLWPPPDAGPCQTVQVGR